jgi:hypothetical protein
VLKALLDTNIVIDFLRGVPAARRYRAGLSADTLGRHSITGPGSDCRNTIEDESAPGSLTYHAAST